MWRLELLLAVSLALGLGSGCAHGIRAPTVTVAPRALDPARLIDYYGTPKAVVRDYRELQLVTALGWGRTQDELIDELKTRARDAGADGVILFEDVPTTAPSLNYSDSTCQTDSVQLRGVAIVYDDDDSGSGDRGSPERVPAGR